MNNVALAVRNVKNICSPVHGFPLIIVAPIPTKNIAKLNTISAMNAFQWDANPNIQCSTSPAPAPSIVAENIM